MEPFNTDIGSALDAKNLAQFLSFSPFIFQSALLLRDRQILSRIDAAGAHGIAMNELRKQLTISDYGLQLLLEMALTTRIVYKNQDKFMLTKLGYFICHDKMTRINMDFTADVCYKALSHLGESIDQGRPAGLVELGNWPTIYEGLSELPGKARQSWFNFDHFYSDHAFPEVIPLIRKASPEHIIDIGGNTGKWATQICRSLPSTRVTIVDLPQQLQMARENLAEQGYAERIDLHPCDLLDPDGELPHQPGLWWMSQFLDCFSPAEIVAILKRVKAAKQAQSPLYIMELFWDQQKYEAASLSLVATSLYFTCLANGNSRFYGCGEFRSLVEEAGLVIEQQIDAIGLGHSLLICR